MEKINKELVINKVEELINSYDNNTAIHGHKDCPLCQIYYNDAYHVIFDECTKCINNAFLIKDSYQYGCIDRWKSYPNLSFKKTTKKKTLINNKNNADYYRDVLSLLKVTKADDIINLSDELKKGIIVIADKHI